MEVIGKIKLINEEQTFGTNGFRKRELVITTDDQYPQMLLIEFVQDNCNLLNNYSIGQDVKISINLRGREWINPEGEAKYFNSIVGWRIENIKITETPPPEPPAPLDKIEPIEAAADKEDDLPF